MREGGGRRGTERGPLRRGVVGEGKVSVPPDGLLRLADGGHGETRLGGIEVRIGGRFGMVLRGIPRSGGGDEGDDIRRGRSALRGRVILTLSTSPIGNLAL